MLGGEGPLQLGDLAVGGGLETGEPGQGVAGQVFGLLASLGEPVFDGLFRGRPGSRGERPVFLLFIS